MIAPNAQQIIENMTDEAIAKGLTAFANDIENDVVDVVGLEGFRVLGMLMKEAAKRLRK